VEVEFRMWGGVSSRVVGVEERREFEVGSKETEEGEARHERRQLEEEDEFCYNVYR
jgi:hypothetical protein